MESERHEIRLTTRGTGAGAGWVPVTRGAHRRRDADDPFLAELRAWQSVLPAAACLTHLTAASVRGWWMPPLPDDLPVFAAVPGTSRPQRPGLAMSRHRFLPTPDVVDDLRVTPGAETLLACAQHLGLIDLTVLLDSALRSGDCDRDAVLELAGSGRKGTLGLKSALDWSDPRSESPWETLLRILHRVCGIEVEPQYVVTNADGGFLGRGDLWLVGTRMLHEYYGGDHLARRRQRSDLRRIRRLGNGDWQRRGYTDDDVLHQATSILRDADLAVGRPHDPSRIRAWHDLLKHSLFTPAGTAWVRRRLRLPAIGELRA
jgi:hypothetical protein